MSMVVDKTAHSRMLATLADASGARAAPSPLISPEAIRTATQRSLGAEPPLVQDLELSERGRLLQAQRNATRSGLSKLKDDGGSGRGSPKFRRPPPRSSPDSSTSAFASRLGGTMGQRGGLQLDEILGERGSGPLTELLCRWKNYLSSRPSWVLLAELEKNPTFEEAYKSYRRGGAVTLTSLKEY